MWCDDDIIVTNPKKRLEKYIQQNPHVDIIISADPAAEVDPTNAFFNAGVFFIRRSPWSKKFLQAIWNARHTTGLRYLDQTLMIQLYNAGEKEKQHFSIPHSCDLE